LSEAKLSNGPRKRLNLPLGIRKRAKEYVRANNSSGKFPYGVPMEKLSAARPANLSLGIPAPEFRNHLWSWRRDLNP
jgi:hypothetical protein